MKTESLAPKRPEKGMGQFHKRMLIDRRVSGG